MKRLIRWIGYLVLFLFFVVLFLPKKELYYALEHLFAKEQIIISNEKLEENPIRLVAEDGDLFVREILAGHVDRFELYPDIFVNAIRIQNFRPNRSIAIMPKIQVDRLDLIYTPFYPIKIMIKGEGSFGKIKGSIDIVKRKGVIDLFGKPGDIGKFLRLEKVAQGHYRYAFSY